MEDFRSTGSSLFSSFEESLLEIDEEEDTSDFCEQPPVEAATSKRGPPRIEAAKTANAIEKGDAVLGLGNCCGNPNNMPKIALRNSSSSLLSGLSLRPRRTASKYKDLRITASDGSAVLDKAVLVAASMTNNKPMKRLLKISDHIMLPDFAITDIDRLIQLLYCGQVHFSTTGEHERLLELTASIGLDGLRNQLEVEQNCSSSIEDMINNIRTPVAREVLLQAHDILPTPSLSSSSSQTPLPLPTSTSTTTPVAVLLFQYPQGNVSTTNKKAGCFKTAASQPRLEIDFLANCRPPPTPPTLPKAEAGTSLRQLLPAMISKTNKVLGLGEGGEVCANNFPCTITTTASKQGQLCSPDNSDHRASDLNVPLLMSTVEKNLFGGSLQSSAHHGIDLVKESGNNNILYGCDLCGGKKFKLLDFLKHQKSHVNDFPYKCDKAGCKKKYKTLSDYRAHRRVAHKVKHATNVNGEHVTSISALPVQQHQQQHGGRQQLTSVTTYLCPQCRKSFKSVGSLKTHLICHMVGPGNSQSTSGSGLKKPRVKPESQEAGKTLGSSQQQQQALPEAVSKGVFTCRVCQTAHVSWEEFSRHFSTLHGAVPRILLQYKCIPCDQLFPSKNAYIQHNTTRHLSSSSMKNGIKVAPPVSKESINGAKKHVCSICYRAFKRSDNLTAHFRSVHYGLKPNNCAACGKGYRTRNELARHAVKSCPFRETQNYANQSLAQPPSSVNPMEKNNNNQESQKNTLQLPDQCQMDVSGSATSDLFAGVVEEPDVQQLNSNMAASTTQSVTTYSTSGSSEETGSITSASGLDPLDQAPPSNVNEMSEVDDFKLDFGDADTITFEYEQGFLNDLTQ